MGTTPRCGFQQEKKASGFCLPTGPSPPSHPTSQSASVPTLSTISLTSSGWGLRSTLSSPSSFTGKPPNEKAPFLCSSSGLWPKVDGVFQLRFSSDWFQPWCTAEPITLALFGTRMANPLLRRTPSNNSTTPPSGWRWEHSNLTRCCTSNMTLTVPPRCNASTPSRIVGYYNSSHSLPPTRPLDRSS